MLSDTHHMETQDQECLKAHDAFSAISDQPDQRNLITPCKDCISTTAGKEQKHFQTLGMDTEILYQRNVEFGSRAILYSYSDQILCVVFYHENTGTYRYWGFGKEDARLALETYMEDF